MKIAKWEILKVSKSFVDVRVWMATDALYEFKANADFFCGHAQEDKEEWWSNPTEGVIPAGLIKELRPGMVVIQTVEDDKAFQQAKSLYELMRKRGEWRNFTDQSQRAKLNKDKPDDMATRIG